MTASVGVFRDRLPFVRIGAGPVPLVVLPGMALADRAPSGTALAAYGHGFRTLARDHTVYIVARPRGLAPGSSTADIAAGYAETLQPELGPFRLMGLSTGGLIAQHLTIDRPDLVTRVALVVSGTRLAEPGREICRRWLDLAAAGRWRAVHGDLAAVAVDGALARRLARLVLRLSGPEPTGTEAADFTTTVAAVLAHDTRRALRSVAVPALVVGGGLDPFFPTATLEDTAAAIPGAQLRVFPRSGHGLPKNRAGEVQDAVATFLGGA